MRQASNWQMRQATDKCGSWEDQPYFEKMGSHTSYLVTRQDMDGLKSIIVEYKSQRERVVGYTPAARIRVCEMDERFYASLDGIRNLFNLIERIDKVGVKIFNLKRI